MDSGSDIYFKWPNELKSLSLTPKISNTLSDDILLPQDTIWMHHHPQQALTWKAWVTPTQDTTSLCSFSSSYSFVCGTDIFELCMGLFHACALGSGCRRLRWRFDPWVGKISWRRAWWPLQYSCLENPTDRGAWWVTVHGVAKSWTRMKWLSMHAYGLNACVPPNSYVKPLSPKRWYLEAGHLGGN